MSLVEQAERQFAAESAKVGHSVRIRRYSVFNVQSADAYTPELLVDRQLCATLTPDGPDIDVEADFRNERSYSATLAQSLAKAERRIDRLRKQIKRLRAKAKLPITYDK